MALSPPEYQLYPFYFYPNCFGGDWPETVYTMGETLAPLTVTNATGTYPVTLAFASHALWKYENVWVTGVGGGVDGSRQVLQVLSGTQVAIDAVGSGLYFGSDSGVDVAPHDMTGNSTPSPYAVTTSGGYYGTPWKYFDGDTTTTDPLSFSGSCWVKIDLGSAPASPLLSYAVLGDNYIGQVRCPKNWTLQGSNDNSTWDTIDTQTNQTSWTAYQLRTFSCAVTTTAYRYYKIVITANNGDGSYCEFMELYLYTSLPVVTTGIVTPTDELVGANLAEGLFLAERDVLMPANPFITLSTTVSTTVATTVSTTVTVTTTVTPTVSPTIGPLVGLATFKLYADGSRLEWMACGADQRSAYQQTTLSTLMAPRI